MDFISILNEIILPCFGYSIIGFLAIFGCIMISKAIKSEADNTCRLIVDIRDAKDDVGDHVKNVFTDLFGRFIDRRNNDDI